MDGVSMPICEDSEGTGGVTADGFLCVARYFDKSCLHCPELASDREVAGLLHGVV